MPLPHLYLIIPSQTFFILYFPTLPPLPLIAHFSVVCSSFLFILLFLFSLMFVLHSLSLLLLFLSFFTFFIPPPPPSSPLFLFVSFLSTWFHSTFPFCFSPVLPHPFNPLFLLFLSVLSLISLPPHSPLSLSATVLIVSSCFVLHSFYSSSQSSLLFRHCSYCFHLTATENQKEVDSLMATMVSMMTQRTMSPKCRDAIIELILKNVAWERLDWGEKFIRMGGAMFFFICFINVCLNDVCLFNYVLFISSLFFYVDEFFELGILLFVFLFISVFSYYLFFIYLVCGFFWGDSQN